MKPTIVVTGADLAPQALALLREFDVRFLGTAPSDEDIFQEVSRLQPVGIIVRYGGITARTMAASTNLRVVSKHGVGTDTIDRKSAQERGIAVKAATGANAAAVAEHTWALILAAAKSVAALDARMHAGHWDKATHRSVELCGKVLGIVGLGAIGRRVATIGLAMGMNVSGCDPYVKTAPPNVRLVDLETLLATADVVSLNCPLTDETRNLIDARSIASMRDGAILVNTGRGGLIDEAALIAALRSGKVRAAGLDTFSTEPLLGDHCYRDVPNAILTPHIAGVSEDAYVGMGVAAAKNILEGLGQPLNA